MQWGVDRRESFTQMVSEQLDVHMQRMIFGPYTSRHMQN
jgi:hypothetical protein